MKLLMENWRRFINEQSTIVLDESQLLPSFLRNQMISEEEALLQEERDSAAISVEELAQIPADVIHSEYKKMLAGEIGEAFEKRVDAYDELKKALRAAEMNIQDLEYLDTRKPIVFVNWIKRAIKGIFGIKEKSTKEKMEFLNQNIEKIIKQMRDAILTAYTPLQREMFRAINLFTGASVSTVRNPEGFKPAAAEALEFVNDGLVDVFTPTKATYEKAKIILQKLTNMEIEPKPVWRGLMMYEKSGKFTGLEEYRKGAIINVGNLSSFSTDDTVAAKFSKKSLAGSGYDDGSTSADRARTLGTMWNVILHIPELRQGADVNEFSSFEDSEDEIIVSGNFKILKMFYVHPVTKNKIEISNFNSLEKEIGYTPDNSEEFVPSDGSIFVVLERAE